MLVEQYGCCGGMATMGLVAPFMTCYEAGGNTMLIRGLFEELVDRMVACGGAIHPSEVPARSAFTSYIGPGHLHVTPFDAEALKRVADEMLTEADRQEWLVPPHDAAALADRILKWWTCGERGNAPALTDDLDIDHLISRWLTFVQAGTTGRREASR